MAKNSILLLGGAMNSVPQGLGGPALALCFSASPLLLTPLSCSSHGAYALACLLAHLWQEGRWAPAHKQSS